MNFTQNWEIRGITLIETMIALFVFSVGILAVASMQSTSARVNTRAGQATRSSLAALAYMERLTALPFNHIWLEDKDGAYDLQNPDFGPFPIRDSPLTVEWEIEGDSPAAAMKRVTVTVRWKGPNAQAGKVSYDFARTRDYY
ncbi:MAG: prepilin-type N-terminal cleavage/methylation domain-containing protein [Desulfosarcinaceae bacterium]